MHLSLSLTLVHLSYVNPPRWTPLLECFCPAHSWGADCHWRNEPSGPLFPRLPGKSSRCSYLLPCPTVTGTSSRMFFFHQCFFEPPFHCLSSSLTEKPSCPLIKLNNIEAPGNSLGLLATTQYLFSSSQSHPCQGRGMFLPRLTFPSGSRCPPPPLEPSSSCCSLSLTPSASSLPTFLIVFNLSTWLISPTWKIPHS